MPVVSRVSRRTKKIREPTKEESLGIDFLTSAAARSEGTCEGAERIVRGIEFLLNYCVRCA